MIDPATGRSRGFGFVCFPPDQEGAAAVTAALGQYNNHRIRGKWIEVKSAASPHKLAAKDGRAGLHDAGSASVSTAPGTCDESQAADSESESAGVKSRPFADVRSVASPHGRRWVPSKPQQPSDQLPRVKPCNVSFPLTTNVAKQPSTFAAVGTPPGLALPSRTKGSLPEFQAELSLLPCQATGPRTRPGLLPWPASCMPVMSMHRQVLGSEPVSAQPAAQQWCQSFDSTHAQPVITSNPSEWSNATFLQDSSSLSATRQSLQKSLEQLLKQQSLRSAGEKAVSNSTEIQAPTVVVPAEEAATHGAPR